MANTHNGLRDFGDFRIDLEGKFLWHNDEPVDLPLKALELLCVLSENAGEVVSKDTIWREVWRDTFVEETNLTHNIYLLRQAFKKLGENSIIQTVPRRGYRFVAPVSAAEPTTIVTTSHRFVTKTSIEEVSSEGPRWLKLLAGAAVAAVALFAIVAAASLMNGSVAAPGERINSIAVMPFSAATGDKSDPLGSGIADILITRLGHLKGIKVSPASAVMRMQSPDSAAVGKDLKVDSVLEGTIHNAGDRVRVTVRLIRSIDASILWTGEFERLKKEELSLQSDIALQIAMNLTQNLSEVEKESLAKRYTDSSAAFDLYSRGRFEWNKRNHQGMIEAQRLFRNAIKADSSFALAYVGLADTLAISDASNEAEIVILKALEIDPSLGEAYASRGFYLMFRQWRWAEAETSFNKALELNPNYAVAHHWKATLLAIQGRVEEAKAEMHVALALDPVSHNFLADLGQLHYFAGEYAEAEAYCKKALEMNSDFAFGHEYLYFIYLKTGDHSKAVDEILTTDRIMHTFDNASSEQVARFGIDEQNHRKNFDAGGINRFLDRRLDGRPTDPDLFYPYAVNRALRGEKEEALDYLEKSADSRRFLSAFAKVNPVFADLRSEPRYQTIIRKMGID